MRKADALIQFKAGDDTRQDAVMEQVFSLINMLLARDRQTSLRKLRLRTYKVIPLQNKTGIIEFVGSTKAFGDVLGPLYRELSGSPACLSRRRAHAHCRDSLSPSTALQRLKDNAKKFKDGTLDRAGLIAVFQGILNEMPPVLRHAFYRRHKTPSLWFEYRLNYARSVATTSISGHILGHGDRHASNILIDEGTGELVHIDHGIAFDQVSTGNGPASTPS